MDVMVATESELRNYCCIKKKFFTHHIISYNEAREFTAPSGLNQFKVELTNIRPHGNLGKNKKGRPFVSPAWR
jgi:hypothetical protein